MSLRAISYQLLKDGLLKFPRASPGTKTTTEELLLRDAEQHHCFFRSAGLHNHLSHHLLAAYDLGASEGLLKKIYDIEAQIQRPILLEAKDKDIVITDENWVQYLGNQNAYGAFVLFFQQRVRELGIVGALEHYVFSPTANENGPRMLLRLVSGALHPFIQVGYGLEFSNAMLVATGIAQAAAHSAISPSLFSFTNPQKKPSIQSNGLQPASGPSILEILRQVYDSTTLKPVMPYDNNALINARIKAAQSDGRSEEIQRICSQIYIEESSDEDCHNKIKEIIWTCTLLMFATGKPDRKPRLDFFLMHLVTSSFFLRSYVDYLATSKYKADIIRAFLPCMILLTLSRGRPIIKPDLIMAYTDKARPPNASGYYQPDKAALGNPLDDADYNPWPTLISSAIYASDSHVLKTMRTLVYAAREYGDTPAGSVIGAFRPEDGHVESHPGSSKLDGSLFVRAAGVMMDYMGWVTHGQPAREDWDRSALGWDDAWLNDD